MKKFITGLFFSLVFIVVLIMLFSVPKNSFFRDKAGAYWFGGSTITFDDIDYSVNLPYNTSLNELNSLYINSNSDYSSGFNGYSISKGSSVSYTSSFNDFSGVNYSLSSSSSTWFNVSFSEFTASSSEFYVVLNLSNSSYIQQIYCSYLVNGVTTYPASQILINSGNFYIRRFYNIPVGSVIRYGYQFRTDISNYDVTVNYSFSTYDASIINTYFSINFINQMLADKNLYNSNYTWSTSPVMSVAYDFDTFTPDTTLYYIKDIPVFNISKTLPNYLSELSSKTTFTEDVITRLKNAYSSLKSSPPNASKLDLSSRFDNTLISAIGEIVSSIGRILYYSAEVATYSSLLVFTPILDMFSYLSIILYSSFNSWFTL